MNEGVNEMSTDLSMLFENNGGPISPIQRRVDPWAGTLFENYVFLNNVQKGNFGEEVVSAYFEKILGIRVNPRENAGHDCIIGNKKVEIKFSLAQQLPNNGNMTKHNQFMMNHVSVGKDWDRLVFFGINMNNENVYFWFTKEDFTNRYRELKLFSPQQGGKKVDNDDLMCSKIARTPRSRSGYFLVDQDWVYPMESW